MILLIDNYDSFVFNLARYIRELGCDTHVVRNDAVSVEQVSALAPEAIILSPGPCTPAEAGICVDLVQHLGDQIPMLGVCLGHQAIAAACGGRVIRAAEPVHGRASSVIHTGTDLFAGLPNPQRVGRYHSLIVDVADLPDELMVTARTPDGIAMAIAHRTKPLWGVQFHPESILTEGGHTLLRNFLQLAGLTPTGEPRGDAVVPQAVLEALPENRRPIPLTW